MYPDGSVDMLARLPLFAGVNSAALEAFVYMNARRDFRPLEPILTAGAPVPGAYLIVYGIAEEIGESGRGTGIRFGPGSVLDEMAMFVETDSDRTVVATGLVQAIEIARPVVREVLRFDPALARLFADRIEHRLTGLTERLRDLEDTLARTLAFSAEPDRIRPQPEHGPTDAASPGPRPRPALNGSSHPAPATPTHGPAVAPGSIGASPVHGSSTR